VADKCLENKFKVARSRNYSSYIIISAEAQHFPVSYEERKVKWKEKKGMSQSTEI
jgi:hypothetical protein